MLGAIISVIFIVYFHSLFLTSSSLSMGPFTTVMESLEECPPTSSRPQKFSTVKVYMNNSLWVNELNVTKDLGPMKGKTRLYIFKDGNFVQTLSFDQDNVCQSPFPLKAINLTYKVDFSTCTIKKGSYKNSMDLKATTQEMLGKKFFYGRFKMWSEWYTKKYRIICTIAIGKIVPE